MKGSLPLFFGDTARGVAIHLPCGQLMLARAISNRSFMLFGGPLGGFSWAHRPLYFSQLAAPPRPGQAVPAPSSAPVTPRARPRRRDGDGHKITSGGVVAGYKLRPVGPRGFPAFQAVLAAMLSWLR